MTTQRSSTPNASPRTLRGAALLALAGTLSAATADDRFWNTGLGGAFGDAANWDDGSLGVPGVSDTAVFDIPGIYAVEFVAGRATDRVLMRSGIVTLDLDPAAGYTLLNPTPTSPSVVIGQGDGDAATVNLSGGTLHGVFTDVGLLSDAYGSLRVAGAATSLVNDQQLRVGNEGVGLLDVADGAAVTNGAGVVAVLGGSYGSATVADAGTRWECSGQLTVANRGVGDLTVTGGAAVTCEDAIIAQNTGSQGAVTVSGAASSWTIDGTLDVGMNGFGALRVEDGAAVTNHGFATIGTFPGGFSDPPGTGAVGDVTVTDPGSLWSVDGGVFQGDLYVGFASVGTLHVEAGGRVLVAGDLVVNDAGFGPEDLLVIGLAASADYPAAAIAVVGTVSGDTVGRMDLLDGFAPAVGDAFLLMTASSGVGGVDLDLPPLSGSLAWAVTQTDTLLEVTVVPAFCLSATDDCNGNGVLDQCDIFYGISEDLDGNGIPDECESCPGDVDASGDVGFDDLLAVLSNWGPCVGCPEDLDGDGDVGFTDLLLVLSTWGPCP